MDWEFLECPQCESRNGFVLDRGETRQLRQCPDCARWLVVREEPAGSGTEHRVTSLEEPPTCPVEGCDAVVDAGRLPPHIVDRHDGSLH